MTEYLYRCEGSISTAYADEWGDVSFCPVWQGSINFRIDKYPILKRTKCGAWIKHDRHYTSSLSGKKFVNLQANKQFACSTEELALASYIARRRRQHRILTHQLEECDRLRKHAEKLLNGKSTATPVLSDLI